MGYDADLGDPYFVDTRLESLPVFTAMHGTGSWDPSEVSCSLGWTSTDVERTTP